MLNSDTKRHRFRIIIPVYPAFNIYSFAARQTTALGPVCVATAANEIDGWDIEVIDENNLRRFGPKSPSGGADHEFLQELRPADIVGFYGGLTSTIPRVYQLARFYKDKGVITVAGGAHFVGENIADALSSGIDYLVLGEGEETVKELISALQEKKDVSGINGIAYMQDGKVVCTPAREPLTDFDKLPLPDFSLVRYAKIEVYPIERIRGCGMDCEFCTVKGKPRCASPERTLERISFLLESKGARKFFVVDDLFGQERNETVRFCKMLRDYQKKLGKRLDFAVQIRLDKARDSELLLAMRNAGVNLVAIGFESPIEEELKAMNKHLKPDDMLSSIRLFHKDGFLVHGMFIFGYPAQEGSSFKMAAQERVRRFRAFIKKSKLDTVQIMLPVPLHGTQLRKRLINQNRVYSRADIGWEYYDGNFPLFKPDEPMTAEEMQASIKKLMGKFYRFRYMFLVGANIFSFPAIIFFLHDIKTGWRRWYRPWRNYLLRFGGWITMKRWVSAFKKDAFPQRLQKAEERLKQM